MAEIPNAPVKRLLIEGSHGCRVSGSALNLAAAHLSNIAHLLGHTAGQYAIADGRKTIKDEDINKAWSELTA
ncbi:histone-like protein [Verrucomicrobiota bacterium]